MVKKKIKILLIEDDINYAHSIERMLSDLNRDNSLHSEFDLKHVGLLSIGLNTISKNEIDVVLLDLFLPDSRGLDTFERLHTEFPEVPIVVLTGILRDEKDAVQAIQEGSQDYLLKTELDIKILARSINYAIERQKYIGKAKTKPYVGFYTFINI